MSEENHQEREVKVRNWAQKEGGDTPEEGRRDFGDIVKVSRDSPPSGGEENALSLGPFTRVVGCPNKLRLASPYCAVAVRVPYQLSLAVGIVVEEDGEDTES